VEGPSEGEELGEFRRSAAERPPAWGAHARRGGAEASGAALPQQQPKQLLHAALARQTAHHGLQLRPDENEWWRL
jgi:hypothetical protein